ncbi:MAG TPA: hypothetical protein PLL64_02260 [Rhodothermales bacterium]|nr:hypothetical protein [Bacteroidota bacterium]HRK73070.1 hypothetical protein [Rhodothermales bacterium]HRR09853.1 hypothetical protein [Rhodothermales bacterium]
MVESVSAIGWWAQEGVGRVEMESLRISIGEGQISGSGIDEVGLFTFEGKIDEAMRIRMRKIYIGAHKVLYTGRYDTSAGRLWGIWHIPDDRGPWEIILKQSLTEKLIRSKENVARIG